MKPANNAPIYIGAYRELAEIAREHGYAMAIHGSLARDMDLICVPWVDDAAEPQAVVDAITSKFAFKEIDEPPNVREHGRLVYTLLVSFGDCFIDLSFTPRAGDSGALREALAQIIHEAKHHHTGCEPSWKRMPPSLRAAIERAALASKGEPGK